MKSSNLDPALERIIWRYTTQVIRKPLSISCERALNMLLWNWHHQHVWPLAQQQIFKCNQTNMTYPDFILMKLGSDQQLMNGKVLKYGRKLQ